MPETWILSNRLDKDLVYPYQVDRGTFEDREDIPSILDALNSARDHKDTRMLERFNAIILLFDLGLSGCKFTRVVRYDGKVNFWIRVKGELLSRQPDELAGAKVLAWRVTSYRKTLKSVIPDAGIAILDAPGLAFLDFMSFLRKYVGAFEEEGRQTDLPDLEQASTDEIYAELERRGIPLVQTKQAVKKLTYSKFKETTDLSGDFNAEQLAAFKKVIFTDNGLEECRVDFIKWLKIKDKKPPNEEIPLVASGANYYSEKYEIPLKIRPRGKKKAIQVNVYPGTTRPDYNVFRVLTADKAQKEVNGGRVRLPAFIAPEA